MWISYLALFLASCSGMAAVYSLLLLSKKLERSDIRPLLESESEGITRTLKASIKAIEIEWDDMYLKFSRLAGRIDREKAKIIPRSDEPTPEPPIATRADILKRWRSNK